MIHGDGESLTDLKERAKAFVMRTLVARAEADGVPPTMRAMYVMKTAEARNVLLGEPSPFIEQEAALRGTTTEALAKLIVDTSEVNIAMELNRVSLGLKIDSSPDAVGVVKALASAGLVLPNQATEEQKMSGLAAGLG